MKVRLLYRDRDFDPPPEFSNHAQTLRQDLALDTLIDAMAADDDQVREVAAAVLLTALRGDADTVAWRQAALRDCLAQPQVVRELYALAVATIEQHRSSYWSYLSHYPSSILHGSITLMEMFVERLRQLRELAGSHAADFSSEAFGQLFAMLADELDDAYLERVQGHLEDLKLREGVLLGAGLGPGNVGSGHALREQHPDSRGWLHRWLDRDPAAFSFRIAERDVAGARALGELKDRGIDEVANALAQSTDHIVGFFRLLRAELAFYVGCIQLHERLADLDAPMCMPSLAPPESATWHGEGLYDVCMALVMASAPVGNGLVADNKSLVVITGANQGGKSSFLRAIGLAQVMLQAGMFVGAKSFDAALCPGVFTHFRREEDADMAHGKFDEELTRLDGIVDSLEPRALVLFNESFAATNEREGSQVAGQVVDALLEARMRVCFVTHLYTLASRLFDALHDDALFLRAGREDDGSRTFHLQVAGPLRTSYGKDLYAQVFDGPSRELS